MFKFPVIITEISTDANYGFEEVHLWREDFKKYFKKKHTFYHNHNLETGQTNEEYPLIQYRSQNGKAGLFGIQEGAVLLDKDLKGNFYNFKDSEGHFKMELKKIQYPFEISLSENLYSYKVENYSPFDPENHKVWLNMSVEQKKTDLKKRLMWQILHHLFTRIGWKVPGKIYLEITHLKKKKLPRNDLNFIYDCFDLVIQTNLLLPNGIALGKHVAYSFGVVNQC